MTTRSGSLVLLLVALGVGFLAGTSTSPSAVAGPAVVGGDPTHYFVTNSEDGRSLYVWAVTNGTVAEVSESWLTFDGSSALRAPSRLHTRSVPGRPTKAPDPEK